MSLTLAQLNSQTSADFVQSIGSVFEHSPWIAEAAWSQRPFASLNSLHDALCGVVRHSGVDRQLALIRAHPDLVGKLAQAGRLTSESSREQASAGLDRLTAEEIQLFEANNAAYQARYGFPFIICARQNKKAAILNGFSVRLRNSIEEEITKALAEIYQIAWLRLQDLVRE